MGFMEAAKAFWTNYADFSGRASRSEYWWAYLSIILIAIVVGLIVGLLSGPSGEPSGLALGILGIFYLAIIIPSISIGVRRLHDSDKSGWFMLLALVPIVSLVLLYFYIIKGTEGPNRFGPDPLGHPGDTFS